MYVYLNMGTQILNDRVKLAIVGDKGVGKSTIIANFVDMIYRTSYLPSSELHFGTKTLSVNRRPVRLLIWESTDLEPYESASQSYKYAEGVVIVYDSTNLNSFKNAQRWLQDFQKNRVDIQCFLVGTKNYENQEKFVSTREAQKLNLNFYEISALLPHQVFAMFKSIVGEILKKKRDSYDLPACMKTAIPDAFL